MSQAEEEKKKRVRVCKCDDWVWSFIKQPSWSDSGQAQDAPAAGAGWAWAPDNQENREKKMVWHAYQNKQRVVRPWWPCLLLPLFFLPSAFSLRKGGRCPPSTLPKAEKQTTVALASTGAELGVNTGCCDVCVWWMSEWPCVVDIPDTEACGAVFFSCRVRCFERPTSPCPPTLPILPSSAAPNSHPTSPGAHLLSRDNQTNDFHCC